jgi:hypothetical protein
MIYMVRWNAEQQVIIEAAKEKRLGELNLPKQYKCHLCLLILEESDVEKPESGNVVCKYCHQKVTELCPLDHCHCHHDVIAGLVYCPLCGCAVCPECGSHDVAQVSRVTGYLAEVSGWNPAKQQELKDRTRSNLVGTEMIQEKVS